MKKFLVFTCLVFTVFALYANGIKDDIALTEEKARTSYAIGMIMGSNLGSSGFELDYTAFAEGFTDAMEKRETQISENEANELAEMAFTRAMEKNAEEQRLIQEAFLYNNSARPEVYITPSGLQFEILKENEDGVIPGPESVVKVNYLGRLIDGTPFDRSDEGGAFIPLNMVIPGWSEGLQLMTVGSVYRLYIPANLAYGKNGIQGIIPQYATLVFDVELLEIVNTEEISAAEEEVAEEENEEEEEF